MITVLTVSEVNRYLRELLASDDLLRDVWVRGEISNLSQSQSGHLWFTIKDREAQLRGVVFRHQLPSIAYRPQNGLAVVAHGHISLYEVGGQLQIYVDRLQPEGVGTLYLRFEQLRCQLESEGLFDASRKRSLPAFPRRIAVVTSPTGAVVHDVLNVIARRYPCIDLILAPTLVQGETAAASIAQALSRVNQLPDLDLIILARGGGSLEDLWPFNEEVVARAIFASRVPVVTGIGHETDVTIADLAADMRAPTPSVAAELAVPERSAYAAEVASLRAAVREASGAHLAALAEGLAQCRGSMERLVPPPRLEQWRQRLDDLEVRAEAAVRHGLELQRARLRASELQIEALSPTGVLSRGYSICWHSATGMAVRSLTQLSPGDDLEVQVADGSFVAKALAER
ncbi:MAG: exodeoxyribonuclease VII large subunit [Chloroflexota bacterium]